MALAVNQQTDLTTQVVHAVADNYPAGQARIVDHSTPDGRVPVLIIDAVQRAEVIVPAGVPLTTMRASLAETELPLEVWVLVEASRMGAAHRALRGSGVMLQPWWEDGHIHFGRPERS